MDKNEIIERLERIARCAIHTVGELPFVMSLDDGIAIHEAIDIIQQSRSQRKGRWESGTDLDREWCICSECFHQQYDKTNYCPNCGADMTHKSCHNCGIYSKGLLPWQCKKCTGYSMWRAKNDDQI